jgi:hypothetical protein
MCHQNHLCSLTNSSPTTFLSRWHKHAKPLQSFPSPPPLTSSNINTNHVSLSIFDSFSKYIIASYCPISCCFFQCVKIELSILQQKRNACSLHSLPWCEQSHRDATIRNLPSPAQLHRWPGSGQCRSAVADASRSDGGIPPNPPFCLLTPPNYLAFDRQRA